MICEQLEGTALPSPAQKAEEYAAVHGKSMTPPRAEGRQSSILS